MENNVFTTLAGVNVNNHVEKKGKLSYLSWIWAWSEVKKRYPDANYKIYKDDQNRPYIYDENLGYMVFTEVTIAGETLEMWLFVMDENNEAMKAQPYSVTRSRWIWNQQAGKKVKTEVEVTIKAATMFEINATIMRCLVKNIAMFGLGSYIYAGEDLPQADSTPAPTAAPTQAPAPAMLSQAEVTEKFNQSKAYIEASGDKASGSLQAILDKYQSVFSEEQVAALKKIAG